VDLNELGFMLDRGRPFRACLPLMRLAEWLAYFAGRRALSPEIVVHEPPPGSEFALVDFTGREGKRVGWSTVGHRATDTGRLSARIFTRDAPDLECKQERSREKRECERPGGRHPAPRSCPPLLLP